MDTIKNGKSMDDVDLAGQLVAFLVAASQKGELPLAIKLPNPLRDLLEEEKEFWEKVETPGASPHRVMSVLASAVESGILAGRIETTKPDKRTYTDSVLVLGVTLKGHKFHRFGLKAI